MHHTVLALDIGFGRTKLALHLPADKSLYTDSFPSLAPRHVSSKLGSHLPSSLPTRTYVVSVNGVEFCVGPDVKFSNGGAAGSGRTLTDDFPASVNYKALFLGALAHIDATQIDLLVLGLPVHTMPKFKQYLLSNYSGTFQVGSKTVEVKRVMVLPQPVGALLHYGSNLEEDVNDGENRLIVDCGYVTTDWVLASGFRMIENRSSGTPTGTSAILSSIADLISKDEGKTFEDIERIDDCLIENKPLRFFKKLIEPKRLNEYLQNSSFLAEDAAKKIRGSVGDGSDLRSILMVGGGARYFAPSIAKSFPDVEMTHLDNSPFCNVLGFLAFGESILKRKSAA